jgi:hypothetical protein
MAAAASGRLFDRVHQRLAFLDHIDRDEFRRHRTDRTFIVDRLARDFERLAGRVGFLWRTVEREPEFAVKDLRRTLPGWKCRPALKPGAIATMLVMSSYCPPGTSILPTSVRLTGDGETGGFSATTTPASAKAASMAATSVF